MLSTYSHPRISCTAVLLGLIALSNAGFAAEELMKIPDPSSDRGFLYDDWRPNRANVVVFFDPLCPYCKKAIPKLDQVTNYNVFVYWAPVFGQRSEDIIKSFFRCEQPAGRAVLRSLLNTAGAGAIQSPPQCDGNFDESMRAINDAMVSNYPINGVPAYFLQGVPVSLAQIQTVLVEPARHINGVAIDWQRYKESRIDKTSPSSSLAIIFPEQKNPYLNLQLLEQYRPEYFFSLYGWEALCDALSASACARGEEVHRARSFQYNEITALLGVDNHSGETYLLSRDGRLSSLNTSSFSVLNE